MCERADSKIGRWPGWAKNSRIFATPRLRCFGRWTKKPGSAAAWQIKPRLACARWPLLSPGTNYITGSSWKSAIFPPFRAPEEAKGELLQYQHDDCAPPS